MRRGQISTDGVHEIDSYIKICDVPKRELVSFII